ncbi:MAG: type III polyketide synthase [Planctomycetota bacterium]
MSRAAVPLSGLGVALPAVSLPQRAFADAAVACCCGSGARRAKILRELYRRSGVRRRGCALVADDAEPTVQSLGAVFPPSRDAEDRGPSLAERMARYAEAAKTLALRSARAALEDAAISAEQIGHLVTVSCTGFAAPGVDTQLIEGLGLSPNVSRTNVGFMGCHAALNGWEAADALAARSGRPALLVCVEICTAHFAYGWEPNRLVANALFADGAAAAVLTPSTPAKSSSRPTPYLVDRFSRLLPDSQDAMTWHLGDHGFEMTLSPRVPEHIQRHAGDALRGFLRPHGLAPAQLAGLIVHPGGPRVLRATTEALGLPASAAQASLEVLREHGNLSSPTVLVVLQRLLAATRDTPNDSDSPRYWLIVAFGPGLALEAMLLRG